MSLRWKDNGGAVRSVGAVSFRTVVKPESGSDTGNIKAIDQIRLRLVGGTAPSDLSEVYKQGIRLVATPDSANGYSDAKTGPMFTNSVVVGVAGGTPPYSHSWNTGGGIIVDSPTSGTTSFHGTPPGIEGEIFGSAVDTVTDANGLFNSIGVEITITRGP